MMDNREQITWVYRTNIPHTTFTMYEDKDPSCRGIVFHKP